MPTTLRVMLVGIYPTFQSAAIETVRRRLDAMIEFEMMETSEEAVHVFVDRRGQFTAIYLHERAPGAHPSVYDLPGFFRAQGYNGQIVAVSNVFDEHVRRFASLCGSDWCQQDHLPQRLVPVLLGAARAAKEESHAGAV